MPFAAPQGSASPVAKETTPAKDFAPNLTPPSVEMPAKVEIPLEAPAEEKKVELDDDDEPDFKLEMDLACHLRLTNNLKNQLKFQ